MGLFNKTIPVDCELRILLLMLLPGKGEVRQLSSSRAAGAIRPTIDKLKALG